MLVCKGNRVKFVLKDGTKISARGSMLHDPSGRYWAKCSLLIVSFQRSGRLATDDERAGAPREYLGRTHQARVGSVSLPPKPLSEWELVGELDEILYVRPGRKAPGSFFHKFGGRRIETFWRKGKARLYKLGRSYRVELGHRCLADDRGIVTP
jgi:hypothetical protein